MKRLLTFLLAATLVLGIAACDTDPADPVCTDTETLIGGECVENEVPNVPPVLNGLTDVNLFVGDAFDALDGVSASDSEDGDITSDIEVYGEPNVDAPATYEVTYIVTDSDGATTTGTRDVVVVQPNVAPVIYGVYDLNLVLLDTFNDLLGVTATDAEDGDITADITVVSDLDTSVLGTYTITYTVIDADLESVSVSRTITVNAARINNAPDISGLSDMTILLDATFDPLAGVTANDFEDGDLTASLVLTGDVVDTAVAGDYEIIYTITDLEGAVTSGTRTIRVNTLPVIMGVEDAVIMEGSYAYDPMVLVTASDAEDGNLTSYVTVSGATFVTAEIGEYLFTYSVADSDGAITVVTRTVTVIPKEVTTVTGFLNYKFASTELRHTFMAAAETYLLNNMYGGVPLFANGGFNLYSSRLQLPVDSFVAVMGYGTAFATMSADDSTVLMDDGLAGTAGEYTYRTTITTNPGSFNQWEYDTSTDSTLMGTYMDALYVYEFNAAKTGYVVEGSMASDSPTPIEPHFTDTGKEVSMKWSVPLRDDLEWFYHPDTVITALPAGHEVIDANDFIDTFKLALDLGWFRAISGGGDFLNTSTGIKNAQQYVDGEVEWSEVGLKVLDDLTLEFEFVNDMSDWNVRYWLSSFVMTPINMELYEVLDVDADPLTQEYGISETTVAYHGGYYVDYYEADKVLRYLENPNYHSPDDFFYTGYTYSVILDSAIRFQEFLAGKLEAVGLPTEFYDTYKDHPGIKQVPGATTFRLMINGLGDVAAQTALFPDSDWIPEPILANQDFKMGMFFAVDRQKLAEEVLKTSTTNMFLFSDAYLVDAELGVPYRATPQGELVGEGLSPSTFGFNFDAAQAYYKLAIAQLIADGDVVAGVDGAPTEITLEINIFTGSESQILFGDYMKTAYELAFQDDENFVNVLIDIVPRDFPSIYYDYMMVGDFDLSIGGISGSALDAASFLEVYASDNRGGFTLNWGIDTSMADIEVDYYDFYGARHIELWSFDAISSVLNGEIYLIEGEEAEVPLSIDQVITPTTVTFTIDKFSSDQFANITYTVQSYDFDGDFYYDMVGLIDIVPTVATNTVTDLDPYFYGYDATGAILYRGDYQIVVNFEYADEGNRPGTTTGSWFNTDALFTKEITPGYNQTLIDLTINVEDITRAVSGAKVFEENIDGDMIELLTASVDFSDPTAVLVTGLNPQMWYIVEFTFDDGLWQNVWFTTVLFSLIDDSEVYTDTSVVAGMELAAGNVATIDSVMVYVDGEMPDDGTPDLFISEYIEGGSNNKAIELYNPTDAILDLTLYSLVEYYSPTEFNTYALVGTLAVGEVLVICTDAVTAGNDLEAECDVELGYPSAVHFNGDDVVQLLKGVVVIDQIGVVADAGGDDFAKDVTLVRNGNVVQGVAVYDASEWTEYAKDTFDMVGSHTVFTDVGSVDYSVLTAIAITGLVPGTDYEAVWTFSDTLVGHTYFSTLPKYEEEDVTVTDTTLTLDITITSSAIASAIVYDYTDPLVPVVVVAVVDFTDPTAITVTGLTAETDYFIEFTFDDGFVQGTMFSTEETPVV